MSKYRIGYTTGVFDMFHIGHLNILKRSKELCDYLIVGVSTDELCLQYKGKAPVIPFDERIEIISSIKYVDKAVEQNVLDKMAAWREYRFDVLFHGDDWKNSELYMSIENELKKENVDIVYFPYTHNISSTIIRNKQDEEN